MRKKYFTNKKPGQYSRKRWAIFKDGSNGVYYAAKQNIMNLGLAVALNVMEGFKTTDYTSYEEAKLVAIEKNEENGTD